MTQWDKLNIVVLRKFSVTWPLQIQLTPMRRLAGVLAMHISKSSDHNSTDYLQGFSWCRARIILQNLYSQPRNVQLVQTFSQRINREPIKVKCFEYPRVTFTVFYSINNLPYVSTLPYSVTDLSEHETSGHVPNRYLLLFQVYNGAYVRSNSVSIYIKEHL